MEFTTITVFFLKTQSLNQSRMGIMKETVRRTYFLKRETNKHWRWLPVAEKRIRNIATSFVYKYQAFVAYHFLRFLFSKGEIRVTGYKKVYQLYLLPRFCHLSTVFFEILCLTFLNFQTCFISWICDVFSGWLQPWSFCRCAEQL